MYRILLASLGSLAITSTAFAADLSAPPPVAEAQPSWTGLYIGFDAGGTWSASRSINTAAANLGPQNGLIGETGYNIASAGLATAAVPIQSNGAFLGGAQIGYNYQFATPSIPGTWVVGLETDIQGVTKSNSANAAYSQAIVSGFEGFPLFQNLSASKETQYLGTLRGRLGYLVIPTLLIYGDAGLAYGGVHSRTSITQAVQNDPALPAYYGTFGSITNTEVGWAAGGGVEWLFLPKLSLKVEYLYYDLGSVTYHLGTLANYSNAGTLFTLSAPVSKARFNGNVVRAGLNYHIDWGFPAPVVAKY